MNKRYYIVKAQAGCMGETGTQTRVGDEKGTIFFDEREVADKVLGAIQSVNEIPGHIFWVDWEWESLDVMNLKSGDKIVLKDYHDCDQWAYIPEKMKDFLGREVTFSGYHVGADYSCTCFRIVEDEFWTFKLSWIKKA